MAVNYITLRPSSYSGGGEAGPNGPGATLLSGASAEGPLGRALQRSARTFWADNAGPPDEREARNAAERFRGNFASAWRNYSQQTDQDAIDGFDGFHAALDASRDKILSSVSGGAREILEPVLDRLHLEGAQIGLAHWDRHNRAVNQRFEAARAQHAQLDQDARDQIYQVAAMVPSDPAVNSKRETNIESPQGPGGPAFGGANPIPPLTEEQQQKISDDTKQEMDDLADKAGTAGTMMGKIHKPTGNALKALSLGLKAPFLQKGVANKIADDIQSTIDKANQGIGQQQIIDGGGANLYGFPKR